MNPKIQITPFGSNGAFTTWCDYCGTFGYAYDEGCARRFKKQHERRCARKAEGVRP